MARSFLQLKGTVSIHFNVAQWIESSVLHITQEAGDANITITTADASTYQVFWGDGSTSEDVASGAEATHTYAAAYDGDVIIRSPGRMTIIESTDGGWDFDVDELPKALTRIVFSDAETALTGALTSFPHTTQHLDLSGTASVIADGFGVNVPVFEYVDLSGTASTIVAYTVNMPDTLEYWDMSGVSGAALVGDLNDLPAALVYLDLEGTASDITANSQATTLTDGLRLVNLKDTNLSDANVDNVLIALSGITTWATEQAIDVSGNNADRTSASDAAVSTLTGNGVTVTANTATAAPSTAATLSIVEAGAANITITTHDASPYVVTWGDGTVSAQIASGAATAHTYSTTYDGNVVINSDGNITNITSDAGGWDFALTALPSTCVELVALDANVAITGALSDLPAAFEDLRLYSTNSTITGAFGDEPSTMTALYLALTNSVITGELADATDALEELTLRETSSNWTMDFSGLPSALNFMRCDACGLSTVDASAGTTPPTAFRLMELDDNALVTADIDDILITMATISTWTESQRIDLHGTNEGRSTDSDSAVTTLEGNAVTVNVNVAPVPDPPDPPPDPGGTGGTPDPANVVFTANFEDNQTHLNCSGNCPTVSSGEISARIATRCMKSFIDYDNSATSYRTEGVWAPRLDWGVDYYLGFSLYLPSPWFVHGGFQIPFQMHSSSSGHGGPPVAIRLESGNFVISNSFVGLSFNLGPVSEFVDVWTDLVFHCVPQNNINGSNGIIEWWANGTHLGSKAGANTYENDQIGPYYKFGMYIGWENGINPTVPRTKTVYHDEIRVARGPNAKYEDVAPSSYI